MLTGERTYGLTVSTDCQFRQARQQDKSNVFRAVREIIRDHLLAISHLSLSKAKRIICVQFVQICGSKNANSLTAIQVRCHTGQLVSRSTDSIRVQLVQICGRKKRLTVSRLYRLAVLLPYGSAVSGPLVRIIILKYFKALDV